MDTRDSDTGERATRYERGLILANLIPPRDIGVEIALAVALAIVGNRPADSGAEPYDMADRLAVDDGERAWVRETDGTYVYVRPYLVRIIGPIPEHLGSRF